MRVVIESYARVGPIKFGMTRNDVVTALGNPQNEGKNWQGELALRYEGVMINLGRDNSVVEVGLEPGNEVDILGIDPFASKESFERLVLLDGAPREFVGFIVLLTLGIALSGFHDGDGGQIAVSAFSRGRWDNMEAKMKPYTLDVGI